MIKRKIEPNTSDKICLQCAQLYEGNCRAFHLPHSKEEEEVRTSQYGMECDDLELKKIRKEKFGIKYKT